jgi:peptidoglycan/xylan/chitin deacetylase (PgdA/CDA1 family)
MKFRQLYSIGLLFSFFLLQISCNKKNSNPLGHTQIEKWKDGKKSAVCITYDGGTANQFNVALPIMNLLHFPATFFIVTGEVEGSRNERKFIGRSLNEIVQETKDIPTNSDNFFERASAIRVLGDEKMLEYHTHTGDLWEVGKFNQAYHHIDEAYSIVRSAPGLPTFHSNQVKSSANWDEMKIYATQGHEFASHSISHAQFGILDEVNLVYELEKSKEEIMKQLGPKHIFSIECPYGTEDERVMKFTFARYEAARNRMPEPFLKEINRWNKMDPGTSNKEYVQWQRGPKSKTPVEEMTSWIDTCTANNNIWLVLVFHGIEGIGWEPIPGSTIEAYFNYIKSKEKDIWIATFQDVTKYIRERMQAEINFSNKSDKILIKLTHDLDPALYDLPLTLKTYVPETWMNVTVSQGEKSFSIRTEIDEDRHYVQYEAFPNADEIILTNGNNK